MTGKDSPLTAGRLIELTRAAIEIAGQPCWEISTMIGTGERLGYHLANEEGDPEEWCVEWTRVEDGAHETDLDGEAWPVSPEIAAELVKSHLRAFLQQHGWQVQLQSNRTRRVWRLADCLSLAGGGGDRLDADYPAGECELTVLCESVAAIASHSKR